MLDILADCSKGACITLKQVVQMNTVQKYTGKGKLSGSVKWGNPIALVSIYLARKGDWNKFGNPFESVDVTSIIKRKADTL